MLDGAKEVDWAKYAGKKEWKEWIPLFHPWSTKKARIAAANVLSGPQWAMGPKCKKLEEALCKYLGAKQVVLFGNGTSALYAGMVLAHPLGLIVTPSMTFPGIHSMYKFLRPRVYPLLVDSVDWSFEMDLGDAERAVWSTQRTLGSLEISAIAPVHLFGHPYDYQGIDDYAKKNNLVIVEDCAHAFGAFTPDGDRVGGVPGRISCFSFFATKPLPMPSGGAVVLNDDKWAEINAATQILERVRSWGFDYRRSDLPYTYDCTMTSLNFRPTEVDAAIGLAMLEEVDAMRRRREEIATRYCHDLEVVEGIRCVNNKRGKSAWYVFNILLPEHVNRAKFIKHMEDKRIQTGLYYIPYHWTSMGRAFDSGHFPTTDEFAKLLVTIPCNDRMTDEDVGYVIKQVTQACKK